MSKLAIAGVVADTSPAAASTAVSATTIKGLEAFDSIAVYATITGATGGTLDVYLQSSWDDGVTWYDYAAFPQVAAAGAARTYAVVVPGCTVTDATTVVAKGSLGTPGVALAAGTVVGGPWGKWMRVVYKAGASTSAGAAQSILFVGMKQSV